jgi:hypothetical protein
MIIEGFNSFRVEIQDKMKEKSENNNIKNCSDPKDGAKSSYGQGPVANIYFFL